MIERLETALRALGYEGNGPPKIAITLLFGIQAHAVLRGDKDIEEACAAEIERVKMARSAAEERKDSPAAGT